MFSNSTELPNGGGGMWHLTHICKCGKGPKVADTHQAEDKPFPSLNQDMGVLIQHSRDYPFQPCKLEAQQGHQGERNKQERTQKRPKDAERKSQTIERPYYTVQTPLLGKMKNPNFTFYSYVGGQLFGLISPTVVLLHYTYVQHPKK